MRIVTPFSCLLLLLAAGPIAAQTAPSARDEAPSAELERLIHKAIAAKLDKVYEDDSGWGHTVPLPDNLRRPRLRRTVVKVGDRMEVPDGPWRKLRLSVEDPDRDVSVRVCAFKRLEGTTYRLTVETDVTLRAEADLQRWRNGLELADVTARADVALRVVLECDMAAGLDTSKVPPALSLKPDVRDLKLNLQKFTPKRVSFRRAGLAVEGDAVEAIGDEFKDALQGALRSAEPEVKKRAGEALARSVKEGKEPLTAAALIKAVTPLLRAEERSRAK
jgi:hypothetical protein